MNNISIGDKIQNKHSRQYATVTKIEKDYNAEQAFFYVVYDNGLWSIWTYMDIVIKRSASHADQSSND